MLQSILDVEELKYFGRNVLMRVDFNVSLDNKGIIGEDYRIRMTIPTIEYLTRKGARLILMSHLDRPTYHDSKYTLRPVAKRLSEIIPANKVKFVDHSVGPVVQKVVDKITAVIITAGICAPNSVMLCRPKAIRPHAAPS